MRTITVTCHDTDTTHKLAVELPAYRWEPNDDGGQMAWACYLEYQHLIRALCKQAGITFWTAEVDCIANEHWSSEM